MIQPLRNVHRRSFYAMAVALPLVFLAGLAERDRQLPTQTYAAAESNAEIWPSHLVATKFIQDAGSAKIQFHLLQPLREPDPLLYFSPGGAAGNDLPQDVVLLGQATDGELFSLPRTRGSLLLYSLGHRKIVDQLPIKAVP
jgi:hypothetical protein